MGNLASGCVVRPGRISDRRAKLGMLQKFQEVERVGIRQILDVRRRTEIIEIREVAQKRRIVQIALLRELMQIKGVTKGREKFEITAETLLVRDARRHRPVAAQRHDA